MPYVTRDATPPNVGAGPFRILELGVPSGQTHAFALTAHLSACHQSNPAAAKKIIAALRKLAQLGITAFKPPKIAYRTVGPDKKLTELKPSDQRILAFREGADRIVVDCFAKPAKKKAQGKRIRQADEHRVAYLAQLQDAHSPP